MDANFAIKITMMDKEKLSFITISVGSSLKGPFLFFTVLVKYLLEVCRKRHFPRGQITSEFPTLNKLFFFFIPILELIFFLSRVNAYQKCVVFSLFTRYHQIIFEQKY